MAPLAQDTEILCKGNPVDIQRIPMTASTTIYKGSLVMLVAAGTASPAAATASSQFAGIALSGETSGASGTTYITVARTGRHLLTTSGMAQSNVGDTVFAQDSGSVGATGSNMQKVGIITEFVSATQVYVDIAPGTQSPALG